MALDEMVNSAKIFFLEIWKSLNILLTFGDVIEERESESHYENAVQAYDGRRQLIERAKFNGLMTSLEMFVLLMTFIIILFIAPLVANDGVQTSTKMTLIILMSFGFVVMVIFASNDHRVFLDNHKKTLGLRGQLVLLGITIFFVLGSFLDLYNIVFLLRCFPVFYRCDFQAFFEYFVSLIFHTLRVLYLAAQTFFCRSYRGFRFKDRCLTRYGLMVLHVANLAIWFDVLLRQTRSKLKVQFVNSYYNNCRNQMDANATNTKYFFGCVNMNGTYDIDVRTYGNDIIYPCLFQFSLLVFECYLHWFVRCGRSEPVPNEKREAIKTSSYCVPNEDPTSADERPTNEGRNAFILGRKYFALITFMNIFFVLFNFLPFMVQEDSKRFLVISSIYCTVYWTANILLTFLGYYCTTAFKENPKKKKFKSLNYLLILSAIGPYVYVVTAFVAISSYNAQQTSETIEPTALTAAKELMFFFSVFCQIPFCFLAGRVVLPSKNDENKFRVNCFKAIVLHMAISNCVLWIVDSFLGGFNLFDDSPIQSIYFKKQSWLFLGTIIQPLSVFFRFNSFLLFTAAHIRMTPPLFNKVVHVE